MNIVDKITASQMRKDLPEFRVGDSVVVGCIITETKGILISFIYLLPLFLHLRHFYYY